MAPPLAAWGLYPLAPAGGHLGEEALEQGARRRHHREVEGWVAQQVLEEARLLHHLHPLKWITEVRREGENLEQEICVYF